MDSEPWVDLAGNVAGRQVVTEANRRRRVDGAGADRSWRAGAEGEHVIAEALAGLVTVSKIGRLRGRRPEWWVLHSVPVGTGTSDIDHVIGGPPGILTINTKHHRTRRVVVEQDTVSVGGQSTQYVIKARREAERAERLLRAALAVEDPLGVSGQLTVRPVLAIVGARLLGSGRPGGVIVATPATLGMCLRALPERLDKNQVQALFEIARRSTTWSNAPSEPALAVPRGGEQVKAGPATGSADFVVLRPDGNLSLQTRRPGETLAESIRRHILDGADGGRQPRHSMSTTGVGQLRLWHHDMFTPDLPSNPLADHIVSAIGYHLTGSWAGPVAISMEEDFTTGEVPPLVGELYDALREMSQRGGFSGPAGSQTDGQSKAVERTFNGKTIVGRQAFTMPGWEHYSTWGYDELGDYLFAQLYLNSDDGDEAPRIWITPPKYVITTVDELAAAIATAIAPYEPVPPPAEIIKMWLKQ